MVIQQKKPQELLELWTNLKEKLMRIVNELENSKTITSLLYDSGEIELNKIRKNLAEKDRLLENYNSRPSDQLLSVDDQLNYERLTSEVKSLQKEIAWQEFLKNLNWKIKEVFVERFYYLEVKANLIKKDFAIANGQIDLLKEKLKWAKDLVKQGKMAELKKLIEEGQI